MKQEWGQVMHPTKLWRVAWAVLLVGVSVVALGLPSATSVRALNAGVYTAVGTAQVTGALDQFRGAIGGVNNGANPPPATGGRREINWDGVRLDGADPGPGTVTIVPNQVVSIGPTRFQARGVVFGQPLAVANSFAGVNPGVQGQFTAFSPP